MISIYLLILCIYICIHMWRVFFIVASEYECVLVSLFMVSQELLKFQVANTYKPSTSEPEPGQFGMELLYK